MRNLKRNEAYEFKINLDFFKKKKLFLFRNNNCKCNMFCLDIQENLWLVWKIESCCSYVAGLGMQLGKIYCQTNLK